jgi:hypothetical protein
MTLRKLTFSVGLLAALLMLSAPAQAETWLCSFIDSFNKPNAFTVVRNKSAYVSKSDGRVYRLLKGAEDKLQLHYGGIGDESTIKGLAVFIVIWKKTGEFIRIVPHPTGTGNEHGTCITY